MNMHLPVLVRQLRVESNGRPCTANRVRPFISVDLPNFFFGITQDMLDMLQILRECDVKVQYVLRVELLKEGVQSSHSVFLSLPAAIIEDSTWEETQLKFTQKLEEWIQNTSKAQLKSINFLDAIMVKYNSLRHYIGRGGDLPIELRYQNGLMNVKNTDEQCFKYAILALLHYDDLNQNRRRPQKYERWMNDLNFDDISFPVKVIEITKFERQNPFLAVNILQWSRKFPYPRVLRPISKESMNNPSLQVLNILLLIDTSHYVAITNLDRFLNSCRREHSHSMYHCPRCLQPFSSSIRRSEHLCSSSVQAYEMPKEKNYKFINWQHRQFL
jgi:hypothetical protein